MKWKPFIQIEGFFAWLIFIAVVGVVPAAPAQETEQTPGEDDLRIRLERLEKEMEAERNASDKDRESQKIELAEKKAERRELAGSLLDEKIELERLKKRGEELRKEAKTLAIEADDLREIMTQFLAGGRSTAERLDIHLREIPVDRQYVSQIRQILQNLPENPDSVEPETFLHNLRLLADALDSAHRDAGGLRVQRINLRTADGLLEEVKLLSVGHVAFAYETLDGGRVGLALSSPADASGYRWTEKLEGPVAREVQQAIAQVEAGGSGLASIPMDVTGGLRADALLHNETLAEQLGAGGPVMFPLAAVAILALLVIIERAWWLYLRNADRMPLIKRALAACGENNYEEAERSLDKADGVVTRTLAACLRRREQGARAMEDGIQEQLLHELPRLRRFLAGLAILAAVAPLLGLLGTVTGIIQTFGVIRAFGNANPGLMAGGISEALITTATGLVIAIPILLCRGVLRGRMEKVLGDAERHSATLLNMLSKDG